MKPGGDSPEFEAHATAAGDHWEVTISRNGEPVGEPAKVDRRDHAGDALDVALDLFIALDGDKLIVSVVRNGREIMRRAVASDKAEAMGAAESGFFDAALEVIGDVLGSIADSVP
jgi:hypothetical protein